MAYYYLDSNYGTNTSTYGGAKKTGAFSAMTASDVYAALTTLSAQNTLSAGDIICMAESHVETHATNPTYAGAAYPGAILISCDDTDCDVYSASTIDNLKTSSGADFVTNGVFALYGIRVAADDRTTGAGFKYWQDSRFAAPDWITLTDATFIDSDVSFTGGGTFSSAQITYYGGSISGSDIDGIVNTGSNYYGVDLSGITNALIGSSTNFAHFYGCKMPTTISHDSAYISTAILHESDDDTGNEHYRHDTLSNQGDITFDTTNYRDSGATYDGTNEFSLAFDCVTVSLGFPLSSDWHTGFITSTGSKTFTAYIANETGTLQDDEVWLEVEYFGSATSTQKTIARTRPDSPLDTTSNLTTDSSSTWTGLTAPTKQKISTTVTVNRTGSYRYRFCGNTTTSFWVDPILEVT